MGAYFWTPNVDNQVRLFNQTFEKYYVDYEYQESHYTPTIRLNIRNREDKAFVGSFSMSVVEPVYINSHDMYIVFHARGEGIATKLQELKKNIAFVSNATHLIAFVHRHNTQQQHILRGAGWKQGHLIDEVHIWTCKLEGGNA